jgi:hypothetical protein
VFNEEKKRVGISTLQARPAQSRELNRGCMWFDFYDAHDLWHFASAIALFAGFTVMLVLDDDVRRTPRAVILNCSYTRYI